MKKPTILLGILLVAFSLTMQARVSSSRHYPMPAASPPPGTFCDTLTDALAAYNVGYLDGGYLNAFVLTINNSIGWNHYDPATSSWKANDAAYLHLMLDSCALTAPAFIDCIGASDALDDFYDANPTYATHAPAFLWVNYLNGANVSHGNYYSQDEWMLLLSWCGVSYPAPDTLGDYCDSLSACMTVYANLNPTGRQTWNFINFMNANMNDYGHLSGMDWRSNDLAYWYGKAAGCSMPCPPLVRCSLADSAMNSYYAFYPSNAIHAPSFTWAQYLNAYVTNYLNSVHPGDGIWNSPDDWAIELSCCGIPMPAYDTLHTQCDSLVAVMSLYDQQYPGGSSLSNFTQIMSMYLGWQHYDAAHGITVNSDADYWLSQLSACHISYPHFVDCALAASLMHSFKVSHPADSLHCFSYAWSYFLNQGGAGMDGNGQGWSYSPKDWITLLNLCGITYPAVDTLTSRCDSISFVLGVDNVGDQHRDPYWDLSDLFGYQQHYDAATDQWVQNTEQYWFDQISACGLCSQIINCDTLTAVIDSFGARYPQYAAHCPPFVLYAYLGANMNAQDVDDAFWTNIFGCCHPALPLADSTTTACDTAFALQLQLQNVQTVLGACLPDWLFSAFMQDNSPGWTFADLLHIDSICGIAPPLACTDSLVAHCDSMASIDYVYGLFYNISHGQGEDMNPGPDDIYGALYGQGPESPVIPQILACDSHSCIASHYAWPRCTSIFGLYPCLPTRVFTTGMNLNSGLNYTYAQWCDLLTACGDTCPHVCDSVYTSCDSVREASDIVSKVLADDGGGDTDGLTSYIFSGYFGRSITAEQAATMVAMCTPGLCDSLIANVYVLNDTVYPGDTATLVAHSGGYGSAYIWSTGATTPTVAATTAGIYTVTVSDHSGCTASASDTVTVNGHQYLSCGEFHTNTAHDLDSLQIPRDLRIIDNFGNEYLPSDIAYDSSGGAHQRTSAVTCVAGFFTLHFEDLTAGTGGIGNQYGFDDRTTTITGTLGGDRQDVLCQVFTDLSTLLYDVNTSNTGRVHILIRSDQSLHTATGASLPPNVGGAATSFFAVPYGINNAIIDGEVWKTIKGGSDSYLGLPPGMIPTGSAGLYHGQMTINLDPSIRWSIDLSQAGVATYADMYSTALHEAIHALGFRTLMDMGGASQVASYPNTYGRFDKYLSLNNTAPLLSFNPSTPSLSYVGGAGVGTTGNPSLAFNCGASTQVYFNGPNQGNEVVYTPAAWSTATNLSHYGCDPNATGICDLHYALPPVGASDYVMNPCAGDGPEFAKRHPNEAEVHTLCDLGYELNLAGSIAIYGANTSVVNANATYSYCNNSCTAVGYNDVLSTPYNIPISVPLNFLTGNDYPNGSHLLYPTLFTPGAGTVSIVSGYYFVFTPSSSFTGLAIVGYYPQCYNSSELGNLTYIFIHVGPAPYPACQSAGCELVCGGDFEAPLPEMINFCQFTLNPLSNTPDLFTEIGGQLYDHTGFLTVSGLQTVMYAGCSVYEPLPNPASAGGNSYVGLVGQTDYNNSNNLWSEGLSIPLASPIVAGCTYTISLLGYGNSGLNPVTLNTCSTGAIIYGSNTPPCPLHVPNVFSHGTPGSISTTNCGGSSTTDMYLLREIQFTSDLQWHPFSFVIDPLSGSDFPNGFPTGGFKYITVIGNNLSGDDYELIDNVSVVQNCPQMLEVTESNQPIVCVNDVVTLTYQVCMDPASTGTNTNAIDMQVNLPAGFSIVSSTGFDGSGHITIAANTLSTSALSGCQTLTLDLSMDPNTVALGSYNIPLTSVGICYTGASSTLGQLLAIDNALSMTKSVSDPHPQQGDIVTYTIQVCNNSPLNLTNVDISDVLPAGLTPVTLNGFTNTGGTLEQTISTLSASSGTPYCLSYDYTAQVDYTTGGNTIENCASASSSTVSCASAENCVAVTSPCSSFSITTSPDVTVCTGGSTQLNVTVTGGGSGCTYLWSPTTGMATGAESTQNPTITGITASETYTVTVTTATACQTSGSITITSASITPVFDILSGESGVGGEIDIHGITHDNAGNLYISGAYDNITNLYSNFWNSGGTLIQNAASPHDQDYFLIKYGCTGSMDWKLMVPESIGACTLDPACKDVVKAASSGDIYWGYGGTTSQHYIQKINPVGVPAYSPALTFNDYGHYGHGDLDASGVYMTAFSTISNTPPPPSPTMQAFINKVTYNGLDDLYNLSFTSFYANDYLIDPSPVYSTSNSLTTPFRCRIKVFTYGSTTYMCMASTTFVAIYDATTGGFVNDNVSLPNTPGPVCKMDVDPTGAYIFVTDGSVVKRYDFNGTTISGPTTLTLTGVSDPMDVKCFNGNIIVATYNSLVEFAYTGGSAITTYTNYVNGTPGGNYSRSIDVYDATHVYVCGASEQNDIVHVTTIPDNSDVRAFVMEFDNTGVAQKTSNPSGLSQVQRNASGYFNFAPNPAQSFIGITYAIREALDNPVIRVYDMVGQLIDVRPLSRATGSLDIDVSKFAAGSYMIALENHSRAISSKLLIKE